MGFNSGFKGLKATNSCVPSQIKIFHVEAPDFRIAAVSRRLLALMQEMQPTRVVSIQVQ